MSKAIKFNFEKGKAEVKESINGFFEGMVSQQILDLKYIINENTSNTVAIGELEEEIKDIKRLLNDKKDALSIIDRAENLQQVLEAAEGLPMCELTILSFFTDRDFIEE